MNTVNFKTVIDACKADDIRIEFDGDNEDMRLHLDNMLYWGAKNKSLYKKATKAIDNILYKGKGWELYAWYDVSSYEYWMKDQCEQNYIQITVRFDNEMINESEVPKICTALLQAQDKAYDIVNEYDFIPAEQRF